MTRVDFHVGAPDLLVYASRLVRKATGTGAQVVVTGDQAVLEQFDVRLWTYAQLEFVPHVFAGNKLEAQTSVILTLDPASSQTHQVLVNLGTEVPNGFSRYERLIELVGTDEEARVKGRSRYKHYRDRGYALNMHDVEAGGSAT